MKVLLPHFWAHLFILSQIANSEDIDYYVTPNENHQGDNLGTADDPYIDLISSLNLVTTIRVTYPDSYNYLLLPSPTQTFKLQESSDPDKNTPFATLPFGLDTKIRISTVYWDDSGQSNVPDWAKDSSLRALIDYRSPKILFNVNAPVTIIIENVNFTSGQLMVDGCHEHWWFHWHWLKALVDTNEGNTQTATGHTFYPTDSIFNDLLNNDIAWGAANGWNFSNDEFELTRFWLFVIDDENASLQIKNSKFENWRFRQLAVIHIYKGEVILTNVDFLYTEANHKSMTDGSQDDVNPGIITANKQDNLGCASGFDIIAKPCGRFEWNGGSVVGHNIDINPEFDSDEDDPIVFPPFLNLSFLETVLITDIKVSENSIITDKTDFSLFNIAYCSQVTFQNCTFDHNWVESGLLSVNFAKAAVPVWKDPHAFDAVLNQFSNLTFTKNKCGLNSAHTGLIKFYAISWVNIALENISISETDGISTTQLIQFQLATGNSRWTNEDVYTVNDVIGWIDDNAYHHDFIEDDYYEIRNPITIDIKRLNIFNNFGGTLFYANRMPKLQISSSEFKDNLSSSWTVTDCTTQNDLLQYFSLPGYYISSNYISAERYDSLTVWDNVSWEDAFTVQDAWQVSIINSQFSGNVCTAGDITELYQIQMDLLIDDVSFEKNQQGRSAGILMLQPLTQNILEMPIIRNSNFKKNNAGISTIWSGAIVLVEDDDLESNSILTIENCAFEGNIATKAAAIDWEGGSLQISDSTFIGNVNIYGAVVSLEATYDLNSASEAVKLTRVTFDSNVSDEDTTDFTIANSQIYKITVMLQIDSCTFTNSICRQCRSIFLSDFAMHDSSYIKNSTFSNMTNRGVMKLDYSGGNLEILEWTFTNIHVPINQAANNGTFMTISIDEPPAHLKITSCNFFNSQGSRGISTIDSIFMISLTTENWLVQGNEMQFLDIAIDSYEDFGSQIIGNTAMEYSEKAPFLSLHSGATATLNNTIVSDNFASLYAGAISIINEGTTLNIKNAQFLRNSVKAVDNKSRAGVIMAQDDSHINISYSLFQSNSAEVASTIIINTRTEAHVINNCQFIDNKGAYVIMILDSGITIENSEFAGNIGDGGWDSSGISGMLATIISFNNTFHDQVCSRGCFYNLRATILNDTNSTYTNASSLAAGGAFQLSDSIIRLQGSRFSGNMSPTGADIHVSQGAIILQNVNFESSKATDDIGPACISSEKASITINDSTFTNFNTTAIEILFSIEDLDILISGSTFSNGGSRNHAIGGAIRCQSVIRIDIKNTMFENLQAISGGGIYIQGNDPESSVFNMENSSIIGWQADTGGGIYAKWETINFSNWNFTSNSATRQTQTQQKSTSLGDARQVIKDLAYIGGALLLIELHTDSSISSCTFNNNTSSSGGAIVLNGNLHSIHECQFEYNSAEAFGGAIYYKWEPTCNLLIENSKFFHNEAEIFAGGAIFWDVKEPGMTQVEFQNNMSPQGPNISSEGLAISQVFSRELADDGTLPEIKSGQPIDISFDFEIVDHYGQRVFLDNITFVSLDQSQATIQADSVQTASQGFLSFSNFTVIYKPNSNITIDVAAVTPRLEGNDKIFQFRTGIEVYIKLWDLGEVLSAGGACILWDNKGNEYTFKASADKCSEWPENAVWLGGIEVFPVENYWRERWDSTQFYKCRVPAACLGGEETQNYSGEWGVGYSGRLCSVCDSGFTRIGNYECRSWIEDDWVNYVIVSVFFIGLIWFSLFLLWSNEKTAKAKRISNTTVLLRILTNYLQLIALVQTLELDWPEIMSQYTQGSQHVGSSTDSVFSFDCTISFDLAAIYTRLIMISVVPIFIIILCIIVWTCLKCIIRFSWSKYWLWLQGTIINLLFLVHPAILKIWLQLYSCVKIEDKQYLDQYMDGECWKDDHYLYAVGLAVPSTIIWGAGLPLVAFFILYKFHQTNEQKSSYNMIKWGFLYLGYLPTKYWWELVILLRKIAIMVTITWLNLVSIEIQALAGLLILYFALFLQNKNTPYLTPELNYIEVVSLTCGMITIYLGQWYLTNDLGEEVKVLIFIIIIVCTLYFCINWVSTYIGNVADEKDILAKFRLEKQIVDTFRIRIPYFSPDGIPKGRFQFIKQTICGDYEYWGQISTEQISELMHNRNKLVVQLFYDKLEETEKEQQSKKLEDCEIYVNTKDFDSPTGTETLTTEKSVTPASKTLGALETDRSIN